MRKPEELHITAPSVAIPVLTEDGFKQLVVTLKVGERETVEVNGRLITVIRDYLM